MSNNPEFQSDIPATLPAGIKPKVRASADGDEALVQAVYLDGSNSVTSTATIVNLPATYPVTDNGGSLTVDGAVSVSGTVTAQQGTAANLKAQVAIADTGGNLVEVSANALRVIAQDYLQAVAEGDITGHVPWTKIGYNDTIGTTEETVWTNSTQYVFPAVAGQMEVVSSDNTQDKAGGTGALTVRVGYLKSDYSESSVTLTLNGTAAVATGVSHADIWRINSFRVMTTGTNNSPVGNLTLRPAGGGTTYGYIRLGKTRARTAVFTVPLGKTLYVTSIAFSAVGTKYLIFTTHANYDTATGALLQRGLYQPFSEVALLNSAYQKDLEMPTMLPATTDLKVSVVAEAAGSLGTCALRGWLE
jgi:hypothetical protein